MTKELDRRVVEQKPTVKKSRRSLREVPEPNTEDQPVRWVQLRLIPIWLRVILVLLLFLLAAVIGLNVGYSIIGDGVSSDVLKWDTWQHILDIMSGKE